MNMRAKLAMLLLSIASLIILSVVFVQAGEFKGSWSNNTGSWEGTVTYTFVDSVNRAWTEAEREVVRAAINNWTPKSPKVTWQEVQENPDIPFTWAPLDSDTAGMITLDADKPNAVIFNSDPTGGWYVDINPSDDEVILGGRWDLLSVAIHEVGHVLGLKHSFGQQASMDTWFNGVRQRITAIDEAALLKLYPEADELIFFPVGGLPNATTGVTYVGFSFCKPKPDPGLFCGGPLPINQEITNPIGGTPHYTFSIDGVGLPFGLTLNFNGVLTGTPKEGTLTGWHPFTVCATDRAGDRVCQPTGINVGAAPPPPTPTPTLQFTVGSLVDGTVGTAYPGHSFCKPQPAPGLFCGGPLSANPTITNPTGGKPNYTFSIDGVGLPFGLTLNLNGVLTGTLAENTPTGWQPFTICATDQVGDRVCRPTGINVVPAPTPTPTPPPTATPVPPTPTPVPTPTPTPVFEPVEATFTSLSCTGRELLFEGQYIYDEYFITGTITGPVGTSVSGNFGVTFGWTATNVAGVFERGPGDPETTVWQGTTVEGALGGDILTFNIDGFANGKIFHFSFTDSCPN